MTQLLCLHLDGHLLGADLQGFMKEPFHRMVDCRQDLVEHLPA